jgi:hypothetical protein
MKTILSLLASVLVGVCSNAPAAEDSTALSALHEAFKRGIESAPPDLAKPDWNGFDWSSVKPNERFDFSDSRDNHRQISKASVLSVKMAAAEGSDPKSPIEWTVVLDGERYGPKPDLKPIAVLRNGKVVYQTPEGEQLLKAVRCHDAYRAGRVACRFSWSNHRDLPLREVVRAVEADVDEAAKEFDGDSEEREWFRRGWSAYLIQNGR